MQVKRHWSAKFPVWIRSASFFCATPGLRKYERDRNASTITLVAGRWGFPFFCDSVASMLDDDAVFFDFGMDNDCLEDGTDMASPFGGSLKLSAVLAALPRTSIT
jgi:hypothetical protein